MVRLGGTILLTPIIVYMNWAMFNSVSSGREIIHQWGPVFQRGVLNLDISPGIRDYRFTTSATEKLIRQFKAHCLNKC
jgi:hypothetical protein